MCSAYGRPILVIRLYFVHRHLTQISKKGNRHPQRRQRHNRAVDKASQRALSWTRLSCHKFVTNQVRLSRFILAHNLGNFFRRLALPEAIKRWSLTSVQTRLIKAGGRLVRHARRLTFQLSQKDMFGEMLERIGKLRPLPLVWVANPWNRDYIQVAIGKVGNLQSEIRPECVV